MRLPIQVQASNARYKAQPNSSLGLNASSCSDDCQTPSSRDLPVSWGGTNGNAVEPTMIDEPGRPAPPPPRPRRSPGRPPRAPSPRVEWRGSRDTTTHPSTDIAVTITYTS